MDAREVDQGVGTKPRPGVGSARAGTVEAGPRRSAAAGSGVGAGTRAAAGPGVGTGSTTGAGTVDLAGVRRLRFGGGRRVCPRCGSGAVQGWGRFGSRRRYRCRGCGRTFSDLTGTPLAYLKRLDRWPGFWDCMREGTSVRRSAAALGVAPSTVFRWRHRLLDALRTSEAVALAGDVAVAELYLAWSEKGRRDLGRRGRGRGLRYPWLGPRVWLVLARDGAGRRWAAVGGPRRARAEGLRRLLGPRLGADATLWTREGPLGEVARFARMAGLAYGKLRGRAFVNQPAGLYGVAFRRWLAPFRGVATRYLDNYLAWHRAVEPDAACERFAYPFPPATATT
jgi:transposase-like protein